MIDPRYWACGVLRRTHSYMPPPAKGGGDRKQKPTEFQDLQGMRQSAKSFKDSMRERKGIPIAPSKLPQIFLASFKEQRFEQARPVGDLAKRPSGKVRSKRAGILAAHRYSSLAFRVRSQDALQRKSGLTMLHFGTRTRAERPQSLGPDSSSN